MRRSRAAGGNPCQNRANALFDVQSGRIDHNALAVPRTVVPLNHLLPGRQPVASDVCNARLHPASVLLRIRTHDLDIEYRHTGPFCYGPPFVTGQWPRVDTVSNNDAPKT